MFRSVKISFVQTAALVHAEKHFPLKTPLRWHLIAEFVAKCVPVVSKATAPLLILGVQSSAKPTVFHCTPDMCKNSFGLISTCHPELLSYAEYQASVAFSDPSLSAFKPVVLLPHMLNCCAKAVYLKNRPSHPVVYTTSGTYVAACFSGHCRECSTKYYHSYYETVDGKQIFYEISPSTQYVQITTHTVFEVELMKQLTMQLTFSASTFESQALVYNAVHGPEDQVRLREFASNFRRSNTSRHPDAQDWELNVTRLEDGWFIYRLVCTFAELKLLSSQDFSRCTAGNRRDIEHLCQTIMLIIQSSPPKWVQHECNVPGCKEGMVTIDGNEKLTRAMCAAPKEKTKCPVNHINLVQCCSRSPITGGKHQLSSKYCSIHQHLSLTTMNGDLDDHLTLRVQIPLRLLGIGSGSSQSLSMIGSLPDSDSDDLLVGCRKPKRVNRFYDRTAGVVAAVRPCGIVVNFSEMFTCESPTQMYIFLAFTFGHGRDIDRLKYVAYDRSCDLHPFLCNLQRKGAYLASFLLKNVKFLVDRFHVEGHTEQCCKPPSDDDAERGRYHPLHSDFKEIRDANTECAEQSFKWLNKYKTILRNMKQHRFNFFLHTMIDLHNTFKESHLKLAGH